jgi:hypothetical protein
MNMVDSLFAEEEVLPEWYENKHCPSPSSLYTSRDGPIVDKLQIKGLQTTSTAVDREMFNHPVVPARKQILSRLGSPKFLTNDWLSDLLDAQFPGSIQLGAFRTVQLTLLNDLYYLLKYIHRVAETGFRKP